MLRNDEQIAWDGFKNAAPRFAGQKLKTDSAGPDPPDVLCVGIWGKRIGLELTKWVEHDQLTQEKTLETLEKSYLKIIDSQKEPRPNLIGWVVINTKPKRLKPRDEAQFRSELFSFLIRENATVVPPNASGPPLPVPIWNSPQGAPMEDFTGFPMLQEYVLSFWIYPRKRMPLSDGFEWIMFEPRGGAYATDWMVQAAIDRIRSKIVKYSNMNLREKHRLKEFDLLCFYCDEALLHNTPIFQIDFGFKELAKKVEQALALEPRTFDKIFMYYPYEGQKVIQVYPPPSIRSFCGRFRRIWAWLRRSFL